MGKSNKKRRHHLEEMSQVDIMRGIRKPMPPATKIINPKDAQKGQHWDWRDALEDNESDENE